MSDFQGVFEGGVVPPASPLVVHSKLPCGWEELAWIGPCLARDRHTGIRLQALTVPQPSFVYCWGHPFLLVGGTFLLPQF